MTLQETSAPTPKGREKKGHAMRGIIVGLAIVALSLVLASCSQQQHKQLESDLGYDALYKSLKKEDQDFVKARAREEQMQRRQEKLDASIQPVLPEFNPLDESTISISVQEETIHNVLYIIARNAGLNLIIEPGISLDNKITISFEDAQSSLVVDRLLQAFDLAWSVKENVLYVKKFVDQIFDLDFVNSKTEVTTKSGGDIFGGALSSATGSGTGDIKGEFTVTTALKGQVEESSLYGVVRKSVDDILNGQSSGSSPADNGYFTLDPIGGQLAVHTTPAKIRAVAKMINNLKMKLSRQVVIDARILEVKLNKSFNLGIDWNWVSTRLSYGSPWVVNYVGHSDVTSQAGGTAAAASSARAAKSLLTVSGKFGDNVIQSAIEAIETFGGVKTLANPHVLAKHGQPAMFTSGTSSKYVSQITQTTDANGNIISTPTTSSVFDGIMLGVVTYINDDGKVDMQVYPIQSKVDLTKTTVVSNNQITLPVVQVKNVMTSTRVSDGDGVILGGLIDKSTDNTDEGVPGLKDIPGLGWLFKTRAASDNVRELVVIMNIRVVQ